MSGNPRKVTLALDALRHGWAIRVEDETGALELLPAETGFAQPGLYAARLLISAARAATLKLTNQREAAEPHAPVMMHGAEPFSLHAARTLADPALDLAEPMRGPFRADPVEAQAAAAAALDMARLAGILPAFMVATGMSTTRHCAGDGSKTNVLAGPRSKGRSAVATICCPSMSISISPRSGT